MRNDDRFSRGGTWQREMRRMRRAIAMAGIMGFVVSAVAVGGSLLVVHGVMNRTGAATGLPFWLLPLLVAGGLLPLVAFMVQALRMRRIERVVVEADGAACPDCIVPLASDADLGHCCPRCGRSVDVGAARAWWEGYPKRRGAADWSRFAAARQSGESAAGAIRSRAARFAALIDTRPGTFVLLVMLGCAVVVVTVSTIMNGRLPDPLDLLAAPLPALMPLGIVCFSLGFARRRGSAPCCAACGYECGPGGPRGRCPECDAAWAEPGGTSRGLPARSPGLVAVGAVMVLAGLVPLVGVGGAALRIMPTTMLIDRIERAPRGFVNDEWDELGTRTLDAELEARLVDALLDKRRRRNFLANNEDPRLEQRFTTGTMSAGQADRYHREMVEVIDVGLGRGPDEEAVPFSITLVDRQPLWMPNTTYVVAESVEVLDPAGGVTATLRDPGLIRNVRRLREMPDLRTYRWRPADLARPAGDDVDEASVRVRFTWWFLYAPNGLDGDAIDAAAHAGDFESALRAAAPGARWIERRVTDATIEID